MSPLIRPAPRAATSRRATRRFLITSAILASCAGISTAGAAGIDIGANTTIGGELFSDFSRIQLQNENATGQRVDTAPNGTGFDIKRLYLIVDHRFNDIFSADLTTDAQFSTASTTTVTTPPPAGSTTTGTATALTNQNTSGGVTEVFIKKLYLEGAFNKLFVLRVGAYNGAWTSLVESNYGYRYIDKTTTDRLGFANTADWGLHASGVYGANLVNYQLSVVNGAGYKNPSRTKDVDIEGRIAVNPIEWLTLGGGFYSGHLGQVTAANENFPKHTATRFDGLVAVNIIGIHVGTEWFEAKNYKTVNSLSASVYGTSAVVNTATVGPASDKANGFSSWASYDINSQFNVFARYDNTKLSADINPKLRDEYFNLGAAYKPIKPLDVAVVYKNEKVEHGSNTVSGADANGSYTIGGANSNRYGRFSEYGVYVHYKF
jgi:hypothetical protein